MNQEVLKEYEKWLNEPSLDEESRNILLSIKGNEEEINDRFYQNLAFGTGGLRGVMDVGTNRLNIYVVRKATQGFANYLTKTYKDPSIAIAYDSRNHSKEYAFVAADVLSSNGVKVYIYDRIMPTPVLSFTTRYLKCKAGIVLTASHNPKQYNGYKVYGDDGCQATDALAAKIANEINNIDIFKDIKYGDKSLINIIGEDVYNAYLDSTYTQSVLAKEEKRDLKICYTPLHGAGLESVTKILDRAGFKNVNVVKEQRDPDGNFTTCPYPNPEIKETLDLGVKLLNDTDSDILVATDPDSDRVGAVCRDKSDLYYFTGNEVGILLFDYLYNVKKERKVLSKKPVLVKTVVTSDFMNEIANKLGVEVREVLTGFKYIGETIKNLESENRRDDYLLGLEESCGYLTNTNVRDKDAVNAVLLVAEMAQYYKNRGYSLKERMDKLHEMYGEYYTGLMNFEFPGQSGKQTIENIMSFYRNQKDICNRVPVTTNDYLSSISRTGKEETIIKLPKSNVLKLIFEDCSLTVRPSGTEPKIKFYIMCKSTKTMDELKAYVNDSIEKIKSAK